MIDLAKFKNIEGNEKNRSEITQIGVLEAIDAYFEGDTLFSEEQIQKMVESNITKCEVYAQLAKEETEEPTTEPTPNPTEPTTEPTEPIEPTPEPTEPTPEPTEPTEPVENGDDKPQEENIEVVE